MKAIQSIRFIHERDPDPDLSWIGEFSDTWKEGAIHHSDNPRTCKWFIPATEYGQQDYELMMKIENGDEWFIHVYAIADLLINQVTQQIGTSGLWGIEVSYKDSGDAYIKEIEEEELSTLKDLLKEIGFTEEEINQVEVKGAD